MIVENDALHRSFAREALLLSRFFALNVIEAVDAQNALSAVHSMSPTFALLDLSLPDGSGIDVAREIWARSAEARVVFWSNFSDESYLRALRRVVPPGAGYGYVLKSASQRQLADALDKVFGDGHYPADNEVRSKLHYYRDQDDELSRAEREALLDIALGLTDQTIADRRGISVRGVENRLKNLYAKLELTAEASSAAKPHSFNPRTRSVRIALKRGLLSLEQLRKAQTQLDEWLARR